MAFDGLEINRRASEDPARFLKESDEVYNEKLNKAAEAIQKHLAESPIVLLSGPSGSGKTTTAMKIRDELSRRGVKSRSVSMDNYFKTVRPDTVPRTSSGEPDLESPLCLDMDLLNEHFTKLSRGERIYVPKYEFARQMRTVEPSMSLRLEKNEIVIFEGIHALNDSITNVHPEAFKLYVSARSNITDGEEYLFKGTWLRLVRRMVRDFKFRGADPQETMEMWANVRAGEKKNISPFKDKANLQIDTAFPYEVCVMRSVAEHMFDTVPKDIERREEIRSVGPAFRYFVPIDPKLLAPEAMLREFIGGGIYEY
jgi:uridine kinase